MVIISGCGDDEELEKLKAENDSLKNVTNETQVQLDEYMDAFNEIQENLNTIKQKEHIIELNTVDSSEMTPDMAEQINNDILTIHQLMKENREALDILKKQLQNSGVKNQQLEETITLYEEQMQQKDEEIALLKEKLEEMNFNMQELNKKIEDMEANIDTMEQIQEHQSDVIDEQDEELHKIYYVLGNKDELKEHNILTKEGLFSGLELNANFDKSYFTEADYRNINEIPINAKKIEILTSHPDNSYKVIEGNNVISKIEITKKDKFWSLSKFLVIMIK